MTDRRAHQCHRDNCDSEAVAAVELRIMCCAPGVKELVRMNCSIEVCEKHKDQVREFVLSDRNRKTITNGLTDGGFPEPDFLTAQVMFVPIEKPITILHNPSGQLRCDRSCCVEPAVWQIALAFKMTWQTRAKDKPLIKSLTDMCVCNEHRDGLQASDLLDDPANRAATVGYLARQGVATPNLTDVEIEFIPIFGDRKIDPSTWAGRDAAPRSVQLH